MAALTLGLRDSGTLHGGALFHTELTGPAWLSGGAYGFEASVLTALIETAILGGMIVGSGRFPGSSEARRHYGCIFRAAPDLSTQEPRCPPSSPPGINARSPSNG